MSTNALTSPASSPGSAADPAEPATAPVPSAASAPPTRPGRFARLWRGRPDDPRWVRPALYLLLAATAALYLVNLTSSGYANDFYAAAVKSGTQNWTAWLFASLDSGNAITVDKPPAAIWLMVLSARIFGFSSFSLLLPQALMGIGTVTVTYAAVRRWSGYGAGLIAGALVATVPAAALIFRFDNPDALLVLLMTVATYCVVRAIEHSGERPRTALRWLVLAGVALGFAFLTKMLQGLLVLPALGLAYLMAAKFRLWTRIWQLLCAAGALIVSAGWFVLLVAWWPTDSRPYIGGSEDNSLWELAMGYNGLGRLFGTAVGSPGGGGFGGGGSGFGGSTGLSRLFDTEFGAHVSWLLPTAIIGLLAGLLVTITRPRTDRTRAALILWGGSMVVTALVFSYMSGTIHPYYTVALATPMAGTIAVSATTLWKLRKLLVARLSLAVMIAATGAWSFVLLGRDAAGWLPWLRWMTLIGAAVGALLLVISSGALRRLAGVAVTVGALTALSGTTAYTIATAATPHSGAIPSVGPEGYSSGGMGGGRGGPGGGMGGRGTMSGAPPGGRPGDGGFGGLPGTPPSGLPGSQGPNSQVPSDQSPGGAGFVGTPFDASVDAELAEALNATDSQWSAAVIGDQSAADYILATDTAVMAIGGWNGSDPTPTLEQFQQYVAAGDIGYFISGGGMGGGRGGSGTGTAAQITAWVQENFTATTIGSSTVYDLRSASGTAST